MNPDQIEIKNLSKNFAYTQVATEIDSFDDCEQLRNIAKSFCKLYYKQQETMQIIGLTDGN